MKKILLLGFVASAFSMVIISCTKEQAKLQGPNDAQMFAMATQLSDRYYYQNDSVNLITPAPAQGNFHGPYKLRYNHIVKEQLGGDGKLPIGVTLHDSALIVKVTYSGNVINGYAMMFKLNQGWNWGWYGTSAANINLSVTANPSLCTSCHAGSGNRDQTLTFTYH
ncbi:MAG TPA: hypothetical protein VI112_15170 [Bacteroidia bacterium]